MASSESPAIVFVIDDDPDVRLGLERLLSTTDWKAKVYASADEFLAETHDGEFGCILLDVNMPDMTGPQLHELLVARGNDYPIIYLTGHSNVSIGVTAMK